MSARALNCHTDEIRRGFASPPNFAVDKNVRQQSTAPDGMCSGIPQTSVRLPHGECGVWGNAPREGVQGLAPDRVRGKALRVLGASRAIYGYLWVINRQQKSTARVLLVGYVFVSHGHCFLRRFCSFFLYSLASVSQNRTKSKHPNSGAFYLIAARVFGDGGRVSGAAFVLLVTC